MIAYLKTVQIILILIFVFTSCNKEDEIREDNLNTKKVLFIGNSYTFYNNMPTMTRKLALSVGDTLDFNQYTIPNAYLWQHASSLKLKELIYSKKWDYVTIQSQSRESALDQEHFDTKVYPHAINLVNKIKDNNKLTKVLFYMTWGYENGYAPLCTKLPYMCNFEMMNDKLEERYIYFASTTQSAVSPCGTVWEVLRNRYPNINLYMEDGNHPSRIGSYVAACSFYTMIFKKDPTLLTYNDNQLEDAQEEIVKAIVKEIVFDQIEQWQY